MRELEGIVHKMEANELCFDDMVKTLKRSQELIKFCKEKLVKTDAEVREILGATYDEAYKNQQEN